MKYNRQQIEMMLRMLHQNGINYFSLALFFGLHPNLVKKMLYQNGLAETKTNGIEG